MAIPTITASAPKATPGSISGAPTPAKEALIWKDLPPELYHKARGGKYHQDYFFQTTVTAEMARTEFGVEMPGQEYELSAKIANPDRAHVREVLEATATYQKAMNQYEAARIATLEADGAYYEANRKEGISPAILCKAKETHTEKATAYNRAHVVSYLADFKKRIAQEKCGIVSPLQMFTSLTEENVALLKPEERMLLLANKDAVQFDCTMKNLLKSGLTKEETELFWTGPYYLFRESAEKILATAPQRESTERKA